MCDLVSSASLGFYFFSVLAESYNTRGRLNWIFSVFDHIFCCCFFKRWWKKSEDHLSIWQIAWKKHVQLETSLIIRLEYLFAHARITTNTNTSPLWLWSLSKCLWVPCQNEFCVIVQHSSIPPLEWHHSRAVGCSTRLGFRTSLHTAVKSCN